MLRQLRLWFLKTEASPRFQAAFMDYYNDCEEFSSESMAQNEWKKNAEEQNCEVDPIAVWEGIDSQEPTGHNCLVKLALHILSVVGNSADCEHVFSHMGLVHTAIHSRLGVEKVCKSTMVGMDIRWTHVEAGLLCPQGKQSFSMGPGEESEAATELGINGLEELLNFCQLSEQLIAGAIAENMSDDDDLPAVASFPILPPPVLPTITIPPSSTRLPAQVTTVQKISIPLEKLFKYPTGFNHEEVSIQAMSFFWNGGIENLG
ncbi:hypothetical protein B0H34DRAFT_763223 [Crassisporium funariophilum]|nr:hypothetical protein B0H34DRAFT_763223 [Crassisporium funariophilum]